MKTLLTNLTLQEATKAIKGTDNTIYRADWVAAGFDPADVAVAFNEDGEMYDVINDEVAPVSIEDIMAHDWCVLADTDADLEKWNEGMNQVLQGFRLMNDTQVDEIRYMFWEQLGVLLVAHFGADTLGRYVDSGKLVHNSKCECPDCRIERFQKNPEAELKKSLERLANLAGTAKENGAIEFPDGGEKINKFLAHLLGAR